ncbi:MAG: hypothetical protein ACLQOO_09510 [Terriglobia bacterium]
MTTKDEILLEERNGARTKATVLKLYEEGNGRTGKDPRALLDKVEKSNPGFSERISAALDAGHETVHDLTLRDILDHIRLGHLDERALEYDLDRMDDHIQSMGRTISKEWGVCTVCVRAAIMLWVAWTMRCDLGLEPLHLNPKSDIRADATCPKGQQQMARPRKGSRLRVTKLYEELNCWRKEDPEDLDATVLDHLEAVKESNPGFRERMAEALATEDLNEATLNLTLRDIWDHTVLIHLDGGLVSATAGTDNLYPDIWRMVDAISKECGVCMFCGRAVVVGWIARSVAQDLGPHTAADPLAPDPLTVPDTDQASPSAAG